MKKIVFIGISFLISSISFAQHTDPEKQKAKNEVASAENNYSAIDIDKIPLAVKEAVKKAYPTQSVSRAFISKERHHKLIITKEDGTSNTIFYNKEGNAIHL